MDSGGVRQEIESHSSQLTNQRIANLERAICIAELEAFNAIPPTINHAIAYHSSLLTFYFETSEAYDTKLNEKFREQIEICLTNGEQLARLLKTNVEIKQYVVEISIQNSKKFRFLMHKGLQNMNYWFRFGKHEPKGIKEILKLFQGTKAEETGVEKNEGENGVDEVRHTKQSGEEPKE